MRKGEAPAEPADGGIQAQTNGSAGASPSQKTAHGICVHCGAKFDPTPERPDYCCAGCQFVHDLIVKNGLTQFYNLTDGSLPPVKSLVFQKRDYSWLNDLATVAESGQTEVAYLGLDLQGISCIGCVWLIEKLFLSKPGALSVEVNSTRGELHLRWKPGAMDLAGFARELQGFGYLLGPLSAQPERRQDRSLVKRMGLCAAFALNAMLFTLPRYFGMGSEFEFAALFDGLAALFGTLSFLVGGSYFFGRTWNSIRHGVLHIDLPISAGLLAAYSASVYAWRIGEQSFVYFDFVSTFSFLMLVGRWVQQGAVDRNRNRLLGLNTPVKKREVTPGQPYTIAAGEIIPVRSKLLSEEAVLNLEWINGESETRAARIGQSVPAGAINVSQSALDLQALESWNESILNKLLESGPRDVLRQYGLERFIRVYIIVIFCVAAAGFTGWWLLSGSPLLALQVLASILVVSCPCALGVALPMADELAISTLRKFGVFVREQSLWERLTRVRKIIFDKTGTLTLENMGLRNPEALRGLGPKQKGVLLRMVEDNLHPVSCCLREFLMAEGVQADLEGEVREIVGQGLEMVARGATWRLGRPVEGNYDCEFRCDGNLVASFSFGEETRVDAREEIATLRRRGLEVQILSGDRRAKVAAMADRLGLPETACQAEMTPEQKAEWVKSVNDRDTLMIGDGANDSLAFNESYCTGTPAIDRGLLEQKSDFYFLGRGINGVRHLLEVAASRRRAVRRVTGFALAYNLVAILLCLSGLMNPLVAAILMPISSLISLGIVFVSGKASWDSWVPGDT